MQIGPANRTHQDANEQLFGNRARRRNLTKLQRLFRSLQNHRAHIELSKIARRMAQMKRLLDAGANRFELAPGLAGFRFVMHVTAAQKRYFVEHAFLEPFERQVNHRCDVERDELRNNQAADNDKTKRTTRRSIGAETEGKRKRAHQRGKRSHDDGAKTFNAGLVNGGMPVITFIEPVQRKIDNHDAIFLHDTHQEEEADDGIKGEGRTEEPEREQASDDGRKKRGKHCHGMHITFVQNSEDDIHDKKRTKDKKW